MPKINLLRLKQMTEKDWSKIVYRMPFMADFPGAYRDYTDGSNVGKSLPVFKERVFKVATDSGLSMLRTLNFL